MPITKARADLELLRDVDARYRDGQTVEEIAQAHGITSGAPTLSRTVSRLGFRFERKGGLKLVDSLFSRPFTDWIESGELVADDTAPVAA